MDDRILNAPQHFFGIMCVCLCVEMCTFGPGRLQKWVKIAVQQISLYFFSFSVANYRNQPNLFARGAPGECRVGTSGLCLIFISSTPCLLFLRPSGSTGVFIVHVERVPCAREDKLSILFLLIFNLFPWILGRARFGGCRCAVLGFVLPAQIDIWCASSFDLPYVTSRCCATYPATDGTSFASVRCKCVVKSKTKL